MIVQKFPPAQPTVGFIARLCGNQRIVFPTALSPTSYQPAPPRNKIVAKRNEGSQETGLIHFHFIFCPPVPSPGVCSLLALCFPLALCSLPCHSFLHCHSERSEESVFLREQGTLRAKGSELQILRFAQNDIRRWSDIKRWNDIMKWSDMRRWNGMRKCSASSTMALHHRYRTTKRIFEAMTVLRRFRQGSRDMDPLSTWRDQTGLRGYGTYLNRVRCATVESP